MAVSECNRCGERYPSAPVGTIHKCGKCSGGYCSPVKADEPRLPEALCDPSCEGLCKAPCKPWCGTCGHSVDNVAYLDINGDCGKCVDWWALNNPSDSDQLELPL